MKSIGIGLILLSFGYLASCESSNGKGDSETHWLTCNTDSDCPGEDVCVAKRCVVSDGSVRDGGGGGFAGSGGSSGASSTGGSSGAGGARSRDGGTPDSSVADDASSGDASSDLRPDAGSGFRVLSVGPSGGASDATTAVPLTATFSESVLASSVDGAFAVTGPRDPVAGDVTTSGATATFTPAAVLPLACKETATLGASVSDLTGHALGAPYTWAFTTADGSFRGVQPVGGAAYTDTHLFGEPPRNLLIAGDGSAFTTWAAWNAPDTHVYTHASRYTPADGWTPFLQFDEYEKNGAYGGATPAIAVSENGEAMLLWRDGSGVDGGISYVLKTMRYGTSWEAPLQIEGPVMVPVPISFQLGADAHGNFVAAWMEESTATVGPDVRMVRYTRGSGWGPIETAQPTGPDGGPNPQAFGLTVSVEPGGKALVLWAENNPPPGPYSVGAERFDPLTGWSGKELLADHVGRQFGVSAPFGAISGDGSAVATWTQVDPSNQVSHSVAQRFVGGSWAPAERLDQPSGVSGSYNQPQIATDGHGTFIATWTEADTVGDQAYASRLTAGGSWSPKVRLNALLPPPTGSSPNLLELFPEIAMGASGDAVVKLMLWDRNTNIIAVDVVTFSPAAGWSAPTRVEANLGAYAPPLMDACGNATVAWVSHTNNAVLTTRHVHDGSWTPPSSLGTASSGTDTFVAAGVGSNGEIVVNWRSEDGHAISADVLR